MKRSIQILATSILVTASLLVVSGSASASAPLLASSRSPATAPTGSYLLFFTVTGGGGGGDQPLVLSSGGDASFEDCTGLWTVDNKQVSFDTNAATCDGASWLFTGTLGSKGISSKKHPGTFVLSFGDGNLTGTWYAVLQ